MKFFIRALTFFLLTTGFSASAAEYDDMVRDMYRKKVEQYGPDGKHPKGYKGGPADALRFKQLYDGKTQKEVHDICVKRNYVSEGLSKEIWDAGWFNMPFRSIDDDLMIDVIPTGCFVAGTRLRMKDGSEKKVEDLFLEIDKNRHSGEISQLYRADHLRRAGQAPADGLVITRTIRGPETETVRFHLSSGNSLEVTRDHGMLLADGTLLQAQFVSAGDYFMDASGSPVLVTEAEDVEYEEPVVVYNIELDGLTKNSHFVVAEGILAGDYLWQDGLRSLTESSPVFSDLASLK